ncbi:signal protein PDZ [Flavobacterium sp. JLP]|uniref:PDZ domain-containing protein n=1 Tax=unclassified Flavobacterium TaxID=196869 RepID=UPI0004934784|nr:MULTISPECIES: PDZ domain-containing protein [unclassified Flavobacterium]MBF4491918.1 signal protein PDZ [Flavobacterium sp. MR2016-29]MBF4505943.1 signal protein PDZ [Flavobacterium sp. JLP]
MKKYLVLFFGLFLSFNSYAQEDFNLAGYSTKTTIPFKLINNLVFIPIKVNGVELNFLLDSGVEETILFSMEEKQEVSFNNVEKIRLRGLGSEEEIEGLKSTNNILETHGLISKNHLVYIILDQNFNLSSHIGIPVNGIIGYKFFKNNLVEINYLKKKVYVYQNDRKIKEKLQKKFKSVPISIEKSKPYITTTAIVDSVSVSAKLLIDIGNSDAFWIFENNKIKLPKKNFPDFLGKGFSGDIEGHRAKIAKISIDEFDFKNPIVSFPDSTSIRNVAMVPGRIGSIGGEVLKRFTLVLDYTDEKLYLKKNNKFSEPFTYNKSGITIQHNGLQWVQETVHLETVQVVNSMSDVGYDAKNDDNFKYKFSLKPVYEIVNIRKNSTAEKCGLQKGDIIVSINNTLPYKYSLQQLNNLLKSEDDVWITMEVERNSLVLKFRFKLEDEL